MGIVLGQNLCKIRSIVEKKVEKLARGIYFKAKSRGSTKKQSGNLRPIKQEMLHLKKFRYKSLSNLGQKWQGKLIIFNNFTF